MPNAWKKAERLDEIDEVDDDDDEEDDDDDEDDDEDSEEFCKVILQSRSMRGETIYTIPRGRRASKRRRK